jgi:hypothetical protein
MHLSKALTALWSFASQVRRSYYLAFSCPWVYALMRISQTYFLTYSLLKSCYCERDIWPRCAERHAQSTAAPYSKLHCFASLVALLSLRWLCFVFTVSRWICFWCWHGPYGAGTNAQFFWKTHLAPFVFASFTNRISPVFPQPFSWMLASILSSATSLCNLSQSSGASGRRRGWLTLIFSSFTFDANRRTFVNASAAHDGSCSMQ